MTAQSLPTLTDRIEAIMAAAIRRAVPEAGQVDALVRRSDHADYQSNAALPLAKRLGQKPRDLATSALEHLDRRDLIADAVVSGPGFVNLRLTDAAIWGQVAVRLADSRLGIGQPEAGSITPIDYSAPNVAKQMHVGHLRTTVIGDTLARLLEFLGARVIRQNHLGDWGTQFGMLIQYLDEHPDAEWHRAGDDVTDNIIALDELYRRSRTQFNEDEAFADRARARVVALQSGDAATLRAWRDLVRVSMAAFNAIYDRLGVDLTDADIAGESFYNDQLDNVVQELVDAGIAVESEGALCVFFDEFTGPDDNPVPLIIRKSDGGYGYATTDLATIRHRIRDLRATRVLYVVDARQSMHFQMIFATARRAGWLTADVEVVHTAFGTILGPDGRPFKTRSGGTVPLTQLLDEAVAAARAVVAEKNPDLPPADLDSIAEAAGIGAVKYADLSTARTTDYRFDPAKMVALTGNTGVYLQYAHTRTASILRKAQGMAPAVDPAVTMTESERALALHLDAYGHALTETAELYEPHRLATYLYNLAKLFSAFYENSPILTAPTPTHRHNRLALTALTQQTLYNGLSLLGITPLDRM
ncbi:arginine--tRNA ligase [Stackebrandtia soli]|uniref:arginine--tRNA ligase n=1 Tax=Stackebrandtia soli TaxID=1892856 RepID=UPI0039ED4BAC